MTEKNLLKACSGLPSGDDGFLDYSPITAVNEKLVGKRIMSVEAINHTTFKFVLDNGLSVTLTPSGIEGDDLDLTIATEAED